MNPSEEPIRLLSDAAASIAEAQKLIAKIDMGESGQSIVERLRDRIRGCAAEISVLSALCSVQPRGEETEPGPPEPEQRK
jgi:acyl-CoA reductase-like NAD-dependent aldehyde dehydrogenase